jgi:hypothetical protein
VRLSFVVLSSFLHPPTVVPVSAGSAAAAAAPLSAAAIAATPMHPFWKDVEAYFSVPTSEDQSFLHQLFGEVSEELKQLQRQYVPCPSFRALDATRFSPRLTLNCTGRRIPPLGRHFTETWQEEDFVTEQLGADPVG